MVLHDLFMKSGLFLLSLCCVLFAFLLREKRPGVEDDKKRLNGCEGSARREFAWYQPSSKEQI
jgi:hypothetical protein